MVMVLITSTQLVLVIILAIFAQKLFDITNLIHLLIE